MKSEFLKATILLAFLLAGCGTSGQKGADSGSGQFASAATVRVDSEIAEDGESTLSASADQKRLADLSGYDRFFYPKHLCRRSRQCYCRRSSHLHGAS